MQRTRGIFAMAEGTPEKERIMISVRTLNTSMKIRDVIRAVEADGWREMRTRGSHRQFKHPAKPGKVTIAGKPGDDIPADTLSSILRQAGLSRKDLR